MVRLESVPEVSIRSIDVVPDLDRREVRPAGHFFRFGFPGTTGVSSAFPHSAQLA